MVKIFDRQVYHGSALIQIAEHDKFTSINRIDLQGVGFRSVFSVNEEIGIFLKYATTPSNTEPLEYSFRFSKGNMDGIKVLKKDLGDAYALLIVSDDARDINEICCVPYRMLAELKGYRDRRNEALGKNKEFGVDLYVQIRNGQLFEVNVKSPGKPGYAWREKVTEELPFPDIIFS